jgi:hypothetical protein
LAPEGDLMQLKFLSMKVVDAQMIQEIDAKLAFNQLE